MDFIALAQQCAPTIHVETLRRVVTVESGFNPFAIGVVGARLERQPCSREEAIATARWLEGNGYNYSVSLGQVNKHNFARYGLTLESAFDPCLNLYAAGEILKDCFSRAMRKRGSDEQAALRDAFSCYNSGNFTTGYREGYVLRVVSANPAANPAIACHQPTSRVPKRVSQAAGRPLRTATQMRPAQSTTSAPARGSESALLF